MEHAYQFQDSFPHQNARGQYVPYFQATPEVVPSRMMFDPTTVPVFHGTVPHGANYSYPCHSCCNNMHFHNHSGYAPTCPHSFPPQPLPCWGSYPAYPQFFPAHVPPPPAYAAEIPRYECARDVAEPGNHHCCGCPNHVCKPRGERSVKIEAQEPSLVKEKPPAEGAVQSFPASLRNCQYPIIWIPPEYVKNKEQKMPLELKAVDLDGTSQYIKPKGRSSQQQPSRKSFFPVRLEDLGIQTLDGDDHRKATQQPDDNRKQLSYPIIWIPYAGQHSAEKEEKETSPKSSYQDSSDSHGDSAKNDTAKTIEPLVEGNIGCKNEINTPGEHEGKKHMPVKDVNQEDCGKGTCDVSNKGVEDKVKAPSGTKEPISPKEKKKLPPVCLRVDPLPRRENSNGSSRSPSPPGARENAYSGVKDNNGTNPPSKLAKEKRPHQEKRKEVKVIEVKDIPTGKNDGEMVCEQPVEHPVILKSLGQEKQIDREEDGKRIGEHQTVTEENVAVHGQMEERKETEERNLSETEAATLLQAVYRGFEVRKWETRKKLKQMAKIREEVAKIKKNIQELESSLSASLNQEKVTKQRIVIGESIMSLLLSLDTIQGLHSSLRNVRKSLARELVSLQERLDSLVNKRSDELIENQSSPSNDEHMHEAPADDTNKRHEERGEADAQPEAVLGHYESCAAQKTVESPEVRTLDEEELLSIPLEVKFPDQMVDIDQKSQASGSGDASCQVAEVKPNQSIEQASELKKSLENGQSEDEEKEIDYPSSDGLVIVDATGKLSGSSDSDEQLCHYQEGETEPPGNLPTGVLVGPENVMFELHERKDTAYEDCQQQITLEEDTESGKHQITLEQDTESGNHETVTDKPRRLLNEEGSPQEEDDIGGEVVPVMVYEEPLPSSETTMPEQMEGDSSYSIDGQEEEHPQEEAFNVGEVLPVTSPEGAPLASELEKIVGPEQLMDDNASSKLLNKEADDVPGPEMPSLEGERENSIITEAPEEDGIAEDKPALHEVVIPTGESKLSNSKPDDENDRNEKLQEENEKLRQMMQKLMEAGKEQLDVMSSLTGRVKDLEKKLAKKKKMRSGRCKTAAVVRPLYLKRTSNSTQQAPRDVSA